MSVNHSSDLATLKISDGTTEVNLISGIDGFYVKSWRPAIAQPKGGGTWQSSPLSDGRQMVDRHFDNVIETIELNVATTATPNQLIQSTQDLRRLLEKAVEFWTSEWQQTTVYLECQAACEDNTRYAVIKGWSTPDEDGPFGQPFTNVLGHAMTQFTLIIERGHWCSSAPGHAIDCIEAGGAQEVEEGGVMVFSPLISADDCYCGNNTATCILTANLIGTGGGLQTFDAGFRFRNVTIPKGATIQSAFVRFYSVGADAGAMDVNIYGEDADNSDAFTSGAAGYTEFQARPRTAAVVNWTPGAWTFGNTYDSPSITTVVQEVVSRAGWVSGNDLTVFVEDNGSADLRNPAGADDAPAYPAAKLIVSYSTSTFPSGYAMGKTRSCADIFVGNKQNLAQITHIYRYDGAVLWGGNMAGETGYYFFPAVPLANDYILFGIDNAATDPGAFTSLIFNLIGNVGNIQGNWEYSIAGPGWAVFAAADIRDGTDDGLNPLANDGINGVFWIPNAAWVPTTINGITAYWVRFIITVYGGGGDNVYQQTDPVFTTNWGHYRVDYRDVDGDLPAAVRLRLQNESSDSGGANPALGARRVVLGLRSTDRGDAFLAYLNLTDRMTTAGYTVDVTGDPNTSMVTRIQAPTGRAVYYNPAGASAISTRVETQLAYAVSNDYYGVYHCFMRVYQTGGSAGDFTVRLDWDAGLRWSSDVITVNSLGEFEVLDFGRVELPASPDVRTVESILIYLDIAIGNSNGTPGDLYLYDIILIPVDEWAGEFVYQDTAGNNLYLGRGLYIDSAVFPRPLIRSFLYYVPDSTVFGPWLNNVNGEIIHQANANQKMWHLSMTTSGIGWAARPEIVHRVDLDGLFRYFSGRGSR